MPVKRTIMASGEGVRYEYEAQAAITPGDLVMVISTNKAQRHATAGQKVGALFAIENEIFGKGVDVDYAAGDRVLTEACTPGMMVNATIAAAASAIVIGDFLESAGDGTLRKTVTAANAIAVADEAVDNSAGGTKTRTRARII
jgi:hypothetical protein